MSPKKLLSAALVTGSLLAATAVSAAVLVTLDPSATNAGAVGGTALSADAPFTATGFQSNLNATLVISTNAGAANFVETGTIDITSFAGGSGPGGVFANYRILGNFTLTGSGSWTGSNFNAAPGTVSLVLNLIGDPGALGGGDAFSLGTATLAPGPALAFAIAAGSVAPGSSGSAITSFSASLDFAPAVGTTGPGGFFNNPNPFILDLAVGNAGGNFLNTGYSVDAGGVVTFTTPTPGSNPGTANITFEANRIPEPGALSLAGVALLIAGIASRRKAKAIA
jgi:hypothetical protein